MAGCYLRLLILCQVMRHSTLPFGSLENKVRVAGQSKTTERLDGII